MRIANLALLLSSVLVILACVTHPIFKMELPPNEVTALLSTDNGVLALLTTSIPPSDLSGRLTRTYSLVRIPLQDEGTETSLKVALSRPLRTSDLPYRSLTRAADHIYLLGYKELAVSNDASSWTVIPQPIRSNYLLVMLPYNGSYWLLSWNEPLRKSSDAKDWVIDENLSTQDCNGMVLHGASMIISTGHAIWLFEGNAREDITQHLTTLPKDVEVWFGRLWQANASVYLEVKSKMGGMTWIYRSTDLRNWQQVANDTYFFRYSYFEVRDIVAGPSGVVMIGKFPEPNTPHVRHLLYSADGLNWTAPLLPVDEQLNALCFSRGIFVAGGKYNTLLSSANGTDWKTLNHESPVYYRRQGEVIHPDLWPEFF